MPEPNSFAVLKRSSLNVYEADIFNCSRQRRAPKAGSETAPHIVLQRA